MCCRHALFQLKKKSHVQCLFLFYFFVQKKSRVWTSFKLHGQGYKQKIHCFCFIFLFRKNIFNLVWLQTKLRNKKLVGTSLKLHGQGYKQKNKKTGGD